MIASNIIDIVGTERIITIIGLNILPNAGTKYETTARKLAKIVDNIKLIIERKSVPPIADQKVILLNISINSFIA